MREVVSAAAVQIVSGKMAATAPVHASDISLRFVIMGSSSSPVRNHLTAVTLVARSIIC
jgi:hypothetical protein